VSQAGYGPVEASPDEESRDSPKTRWTNSGGNRQSHPKKVTESKRHPHESATWTQRF